MYQLSKPSYILHVESNRSNFGARPFPTIGQAHPGLLSSSAASVPPANRPWRPQEVSQEFKMWHLEMDCTTTIYSEGGESFKLEMRLKTYPIMG